MIKLDYINTNDKIEIITKLDINKDNYTKYIRFEDTLNIFVLRFEKTNDGYLIYPSKGFQEDVVYYISLLSNDIKFKEYNTNELVLKIKKGYILPLYWKEYLDKKILLINEKLKESDYSFIYLTDCHLSTNYLNFASIIKYLLANTEIDDCMFGGDVCTYYGKKIKALEDIVKWNELTYDIEMISAYGNHDANSKEFISDSEYMDKLDFKNLCMSNSKVDYVNNELYGIYDIVDKKIRVIVLDTGVYKMSELDEEELNFMKDKMLDLDSDYSVIILAHKFFCGTEQNERHPNIVLHEEGIKIKNAIDSIYDKLKCNLIGVFSGHNHIDCDRVDKYPMIATTCDSSGWNALYDANYPIREEDTINSQALDIVFINKKNRTIDTLRIGVGDKTQDRKYNY